MTDITLGDFERAVKTTATTVLRNEQYFSDLDGIAGDGDFGASLASGFRIVDADFETLDKSGIGDLLLKISMIITRNVGGCSGPIWGTGFMRAAMLSKGKSEISLAELGAMLQSAVEGIQARGGAQLGDKTLLDAVIPVTEHVKAAAEAGRSDLGAVLSECAGIAAKAIEETRGLRPRRGRQSFVGERATGSVDPGIVAIATILGDICGEFGAVRPEITA